MNGLTMDCDFSRRKKLSIVITAIVVALTAVLPCNAVAQRYFDEAPKSVAPFDREGESQMMLPTNGLPIGLPDARTNNAPTGPQEFNEFRGGASDVVADVRIVGNDRVPTDQVLARLRSRAGRSFDRDLIQADASEIMRMRFFQNVKTFTRPTPDGTIVTFEVTERPFIGEIKIIGNRYITDRKLMKEIDLKAGMPLDIYQVKLARQKLKNYYIEQGYPRSDVTIVEGDKLEDRNVVILVHEDEPQRISRIDIEGSQIVSEARLKTFLKSKPSVLRMVGGKFNRQQVEQDRQILSAYYNSLGFFNSRVGVEVLAEEDSSWLSLRFIVDEGPRFSVRNVNFVGQQKYESQRLAGLMDLKPGEVFNAATMTRDETSLQDLYGSEGHIAAEITGEVIYLEEGNQVDLVYRIDEGAQYRVGRINVEIAGDHPITRKQVVLNRIGLKPGDVIDMRKIRASEVRLARSQLFNAQGAAPPQLAVKPRDPSTSIAQAGGERGNVRWQSPDSDSPNRQPTNRSAKKHEPETILLDLKDFDLR